MIHQPSSLGRGSRGDSRHQSCQAASISPGHQACVLAEVCFHLRLPLESITCDFYHVELLQVIQESGGMWRWHSGRGAVAPTDT